MTTRYERVTFHDGERRRTVILKDLTHIAFMGASCLSGTEVDHEGEEVAPRGADERRRIIALGVITRRVPMVMNLHYGTLEEAS